MSYDIQIKGIEKSITYENLKAHLHNFPHTTDLRLEIGDDYYMEIDLEYAETADESEDAEIAGIVNLINFHIPYHFMDNQNIEHDVYFDYILKLSEYVDCKAYDLQLDLFLDDPEFEKKKRRMLMGNFSAYFNTIEKQGNQLHFSSKTTENSSISVDLESFNIDFRSEVFKEKGNRPDFQLILSQKSSDSTLIALRHWKEKVIKIYPLNENLLDSFSLAELWKSDPKTTIEKCGQVVTMEFSSDNKTLISTSYKNKTLKLWQVSSAKLIRNFTSYARHISSYFQINEKLMCITTSAGIGFFDTQKGELIVHLTPLTNNWIVFTPNGDFDFKSAVNGAVELDWIDNDKNESYCFIPSLGFAYYERWGSFNLNKLEEKRGEKTEGFLKKMLLAYM